MHTPSYDAILAAMKRLADPDDDCHAGLVGPWQTVAQKVLFGREVAPDEIRTDDQPLTIGQMLTKQHVDESKHDAIEGGMRRRYYRIDIDLLLARPNEIVACPAFLKQSSGMESQIGCIGIVGGISIVGAEMMIVSVICIIQEHKPGFWRSWYLHIGARNDLAFTWVDSEISPLHELPVPNTIIYFSGVSDKASLARSDASLTDLIAVARYVIPFLHD
jgi:hypothetical protein